MILYITSICESTAETIVVVAIVVLSVVVLSVVVLSISILSIVVLSSSILAVVVLTIAILSIVVAIVVIGGIAAAATVVGCPTKQIIEEPFIPSVLPLFCLPPLPASVTGTGAASWKEKPGLTIITSLAFATFAARVASVAVVQSTSNCRTKDCGTEGTQTGSNKAPVQSIVAREEPCVCVQRTERELLS